VDSLTKTQRSQLMSRVRQRGTALEMRLRAALRETGLAYRTNVRLPGTPDIVLTNSRIAVFVDGCFWHGCPKHGTMPKTNTTFWRHKIKRNRQRDAEVDGALRGLGWKSVRVWEHDLRASPASVVRRLAILAKRRPKQSSQARKLRK
jgi:DNA mismatch endonuclease (patch repair protein)